MKTRLPKLCRNKWRDAAFVYCGKRKIYLGKWGAPATIAAYRRSIAELASGRVSVAESAEAEKTVVTVAELAVAFLSDKKITTSTAAPRLGNTSVTASRFRSRSSSSPRLILLSAIKFCEALKFFAFPARSYMNLRMSRLT